MEFKKFNVKKRPRRSECCAMRCKGEALHTASNLSFCQKHWDLIEEDELEPEKTEVDPEIQGNVRKDLGITIEPVEAEEEKTELEEALELTKEKMTDWFDQLKDLEIKDNDMLEAASDILKEVKSDGKLIDIELAKKLEVIKAAYKDLKELFGPVTNIISGLEEALKQAIINYTDEIEQAKVQALADGDLELAEQLEQIDLPKGISKTTLWSYEVDDLTLIPGQYLKFDVDKKKVGELLKDQREKLAIPGIRVFSKSSLTVRTDND